MIYQTDLSLHILSAPATNGRACIAHDGKDTDQSDTGLASLGNVPQQSDDSLVILGAPCGNPGVLQRVASNIRRRTGKFLSRRPGQCGCCPLRSVNSFRIFGFMRGRVSIGIVYSSPLTEPCFLRVLRQQLRVDLGQPFAPSQVWAVTPGLYQQRSCTSPEPRTIQPRWCSHLDLCSSSHLVSHLSSQPCSSCISLPLQYFHSYGVPFSEAGSSAILT